MSVSMSQRHKRSRPCLVCGGGEDDPRGNERRCHGFISADGEWEHCSREEHAGALEQESGGTYAHRLHGPCRCGVQHGEARTGPREVFVAEYDYRDEHGSLVFQVVRKANKRFVQRRPDGDRWVYSLVGVRRLLYRLPELLASNPAAVVYICEGEKDVDNVREAGFTATCNPMGAEKWAPVAELGRKALRDRQVIIIADADAKGRKHATEVAASLEGHARSVQLMEPPAPHKDASDMLTAGLTLNDLVPMGTPREDAEPEPPSPIWERQILRSRDGEGAVKKLITNVDLILSNAPEWSGCIGWDAFAERIMVLRKCPAGEPGPWTDHHDKLAAVWLQRSRWALEAGHDLVAHAIELVAKRRPFHPLRERLDALTWDGVPRLDTWTTTYLGAENTLVHSAFGVRWAIGAVARVFEPGCQMDSALILEGPQGLGKSSALNILSLGFFTDDLSDVSNKDAAMQLHGNWIVEIAELDAISKADAAKVKAFITRRVDKFRAPYGRHIQEHPRSCVFAGSVNHADYLADETGGRRFWPIACTRIDRDALRRDVEQLWAEAVVRYRRGEVQFIDDVSIALEAEGVARSRYRLDAWDPTLAKYLETRIAIQGFVTVQECLEHLGIDKAKWTQADSNRIVKILKHNGLERRQVRNGKAREYRYVMRVT